MTEEGTPVTPPSSEPEQTPSAPVQAPAPPVTPDEVAILKARLEEKESFIGKQANEVGYLRSMVEQFQQARTQEPVEQAPERTRQKINWDNPDESIERLVEEKLQAKERAREQSERARRDVEAKSNFYEGRDTAFKENKRLYEGIEDAVSQAVQNAYQSGLINERSLASPRTWKRAAQLILLEQDKLDRLVSTGPTPVKPTATETPVARPISTEEVSYTISEEDRRWGRDQGLSDKQLEELAEIGLKAVAEGKTRTSFRR